MQQLHLDSGPSSGCMLACCTLLYTKTTKEHPFTVHVSPTLLSILLNDDLHCLQCILPQPDPLAPAVCHALKSEPGPGSRHLNCRGVCKNRVFSPAGGAPPGGRGGAVFDAAWWVDVLLCVCLVQNTKLLTCDSTGNFPQFHIRGSEVTWCRCME